MCLPVSALRHSPVSAFSQALPLGRRSRLARPAHPAPQVRNPTWRKRSPCTSLARPPRRPSWRPCRRPWEASRHGAHEHRLGVNAPPLCQQCSRQLSWPAPAQLPHRTRKLMSGLGPRQLQHVSSRPRCLHRRAQAAAAAAGAVATFGAAATGSSRCVDACCRHAAPPSCCPAAGSSWLWALRRCWYCCRQQPQPRPTASIESGQPGGHVTERRRERAVLLRAGECSTG